MHELSVATKILDLALAQLREQQLDRIHRIDLRVGVMQGYEPKWMQHYFDRLAADTPAAGAVLCVESVPITFCCRDCGHVFALDVHGTDDCSCPQCHGFSYDMVSGKEFLIERMEASRDV